MKRSSDRISIAGLLVSTRPPAASSAVESLAPAPAAHSAAARPAAAPAAFEIIRIRPSPALSEPHSSPRPARRGEAERTRSVRPGEGRAAKRRGARARSERRTMREARSGRRAGALAPRRPLPARWQPRPKNSPQSDRKQRRPDRDPPARHGALPTLEVAASVDPKTTVDNGALIVAPPARPDPPAPTAPLRRKAGSIHPEKLHVVARHDAASGTTRYPQRRPRSLRY